MTSQVFSEAEEVEFSTSDSSFHIRQRILIELDSGKQINHQINQKEQQEEGVNKNLISISNKFGFLSLVVSDFKGSFVFFLLL